MEERKVDIATEDPLQCHVDVATIEEVPNVVLNPVFSLLRGVRWGLAEDLAAR